MSVVIDGTTGITAAAFDGAVDAADLTGTLPALDGSALTNLSAGNLTGNVAADRITGALNATGSAPIYACRAWVNFNGTGTVAIRGSGNVSSITDNGTGDYTINFVTPMPDANYAVTVGTTSFGNGASPQDGWGISGSSDPTASSLRMLAGLSCASSTLGDIPQCHVAIFR